MAVSNRKLKTLRFTFYGREVHYIDDLSEGQTVNLKCSAHCSYANLPDEFYDKLIHDNALVEVVFRLHCARFRALHEKHPSVGEHFSVIGVSCHTHL